MGGFKLEYRAIAREIGKGNFSPIYVCYGPETYLMNEFIEYLIEKWLPPEDREFAVSKFDLADTNVAEAIDDAETMPFVGSRKLIIARDAAFLSSAKESGKIDHKPDRLMAYMESPPDFSIIVLTVSADKLDERKKIVKSITSRKASVPFPVLTGDDLNHWVRRQSDKLRLSYVGGADQTLIMHCGGNLQTLAGEIRKLSLYAGEGGAVDNATIERLVARSAEQNVFLMIDEMIGLRLERALDIYRDLLLNKEEPVKIVALMARQFRHLLFVKQLGEQGMSQQQMASQLSLHPYAVKIAMDQARRFEADKLRLGLERLATLDYQMKTGQIDKELGIELFMLGLAG